MSARGITWTALLLVTVGFAAGRAFSQNEIPGGDDAGTAAQATDSTTTPLTAPATTSPADAFDIPMPPTSFQSTETAPAPTRPANSPRLTTMPAKYYIPAGKPKEDVAVDSLRERFAKIAAEKAAIMTADELQSEIAAIERILVEFSAKQSLDRAVKALEAVVGEYPDTEAERDAKRALDTLKVKSVDTRRTTLAR